MIALDRAPRDVRLRAPSTTASVPKSRLLASPFLSSEERRALAEAMLPAKRFKPNKDLAREGDRVDCLYFVTEGWACRYVMTAAGGRQITALLVPGDVGNLDTFMFDRLDYGLRTLSEAIVAPLPKGRARALAAMHPGIAQMFTSLAMVENTILSARAVSLGRRSATERLAHLFCELSVRLDPDGDGSRRFELPLTQEQLGDTLGLTSVHVNRTMRQMREDGLVNTSNRMISVPDIDKLRCLGGFDERYVHAGNVAGQA